MHTIQAYRLTRSPGETYAYVTEASEIGFPVNMTEWPKQFTVEPHFGNGQPFIQHRLEVRTLELERAIYAQVSGCVTIKVYND